MDGFDEEFTAPPPAADAPAVTEPISLDELTGSASQAPLAVNDFTVDAQATQDAFIGGYTPHVISEAPAPEITDPRVAWRKKNQDALKAKDAEEAAARKALADKAKEHLKKVQEARTKQLSGRKDTNRATTAADSPEAGVPKDGSAWDKVAALVNFTAGVHQKDVSRFKSTLISLKTVKA